MGGPWQTERMRPLLVAVEAAALCLVVSSTRVQAQAAPATRAAGGELVPFWLVIPEYPQIAQSARVSGVVIVAMTVNADGRVESATLERDVPLLSPKVMEAARDSGFICRGCTGKMAYRITYEFRFVDSIEQAESARGIIAPTAATLPVVARTPVLNIDVAATRRASGGPLEHPEQEP